MNKFYLQLYGRRVYILWRNDVLYETTFFRSVILAEFHFPVRGPVGDDPLSRDGVADGDAFA